MKLKILFPLFFLVILLSACSRSENAQKSLEILSKPLTIDRKYKSMKGPDDHQVAFFPKRQSPELLWITGYQALNVGEDGKSKLPQEFMCHSIFDVDLDRHSKLFGWTKRVNSRLFTASQGQASVKLPEGFGIPIMSDETFYLGTQVLNHNEDSANFKVRQKVNVDFVRDAELTNKVMRPLYVQSVYGLALLEGRDAYFDISEPDNEKHGPGCMEGMTASPDNVLDDPYGRKFTGHWTVKPGRHENRTLVTKLLELPFDTTVHYIAVHLHPFAESLELKDLTAGETIFKSGAINFKDRIGLERVDYFSSPEGKKLYKEHQYEMVSVYNNTSSVDQDSMAVMYLYLLDKEFRKPQLVMK